MNFDRDEQEELRLIAGAGGGGGKGGGGGSSRSPVEDPDTLQSVSFARVLDLVSEGEIEGLVDGLKSIYLDDTPIQNADGSMNFSGVTAVWNNGTQTQSYLPGFPNVESETAVAVEVKQSASVVRQITDANTDAIRVTLAVPGLSRLDMSTGDLHGTSVQISIDVQPNGGSYTQVVTDTIAGKTRSKYLRSYRIALVGNAPWNVRVRRLTADSTTSNLANQTWWESYTSIIDRKLRYPNSALVGLSIDARQFNSVPKRGYHIRGMKIKVPVNYDPVQRTYSGSWSGQFKTVYSNNPAWVLYDLATSERYGLGKRITSSNLDKWALYTIGQYCDELVSDGFGGTEPRFTCNTYLQDRVEAYTLFNDLASVFRGMAYWSTDKVTVVQDSPAAPTMIFSPANVLDGMFNYAGSARSARHTVALVGWNDPEDMYRRKWEYVEDEAGIQRYGVREKQVVAFGCTSRGQANRVGRWLLYTERMESDVVSFKVGLDAALLTPGRIIQINDTHRAGKRLSGRITATTSTSVGVDSAVTFESGKTYTLKLVLPDGSVVQRELNNTPGTTSTLTWTLALGTLPLLNSVWLLSVSDLQPLTARVIAVKELQGGTTFEISALEHNPSKFGAIEQGLILQDPPITDVSVIPPIVTGLAAVENTHVPAAGSGARIGLHISWDRSTSAQVRGYLITLRRQGGDNIVNYPEQAGVALDVMDILPGTYTITARTVNYLGNPSVPVSITYSVSGTGSLAPIQLPPVNNLALYEPWNSRVARFKWEANPNALNYKVEVWALGVLRRTVNDVRITYFEYSYDTAATDGGPWRTITLKVYAVSAAGVTGEAATLVVANPQVGLPTAIQVVGGLTSISVSCAKPTDADYSGTKIWINSTSGYDPLSTSPAYDGPNTNFTGLNFPAGTPQYVRIAHYDVYGTDGLNISAEVMVTPVGANGGIDVVNELPTTNLTEGRVIYLTTDEKLYRYDGIAWRTWVDGSDILAASVTAGKLSVSNLSAITGAMGSLISGDITLDAAGFLRGGQTDYNAGNGFWMGYRAGSYKLSLGNSDGNRLLWDGTALDIVGTLRGGQTDYNTGSGFWLGAQAGTYKFSVGSPTGARMLWTGSGFELYAANGALLLSSGVGVPYTSVAGRPTSARNLLDASTWELGTTGNQPGFTYIGRQAGDNQIALVGNPHTANGLPRVKSWVGTCSDSVFENAAGTGGFSAAPKAIDRNKAYRFSVWFLVAAGSTGHVYLGATPDGTILNMDGSANTNPYFAVIPAGQIAQGTWYQLVGLIQPYGTENIPSGMSGLYDRSGRRVNAGVDYKFSASAVDVVFRAFMFYAYTPNEYVVFQDPRLEEWDNGTMLHGTYISALSVDTLQIAGNAITVPVHVYGQGGVTPVQASWVDVISLTTEAYGSPIMLLFSHLNTVAISYPSGKNNYTTQFTWRIVRNGTVIWQRGSSQTGAEGGPAPSVFSDTPPSGVTTYTVQLFFYSNATFTGSIQERSLLALETRR